MNRAEADLIARRTIARYAAAIDHKDFDAVAAVFSEDSELRRSGIVTEGREAITAFFSGHLPTIGHMRHHMTNILAEPDGNLIVTQCLFSYVQVLDEGVRFGWGNYDDVIRPTTDSDGVFVEKEITIHHSQVFSLEDVNPDLLPGGIQGI
jgi:hypothetical protein